MKQKAYLKKFSNVNDDVFEGSACLLTISVGQASHENEHFSAVVDLINNKFSSCTITLHDTLQRHTAALSSSIDAVDLHQALLKQGDLWLERNSKFYEKLTIPMNIMRWDEWLNQPDFEIYKSKVEGLIKSDKQYANFFNCAMNDFLARFQKRIDNPYDFDTARAEKLCMDYLIEECAVLCLWPDTDCQYELYTGKHNVAMQATWQYFIGTKIDNPIRSLQIGFRSRKDLIPQRFDYTANEKVEVE